MNGYFFVPSLTNAIRWCFLQTMAETFAKKSRSRCLLFGLFPLYFHPLGLFFELLGLQAEVVDVFPVGHE
jgi:hypothetical protein